MVAATQDIALSVQLSSAKNKMVVVSPRPPSARLLYPRIKQDLKGRRFVDVAEVQRETLAALDSISVEDFRLFPAVGAALRSLHPITRGVL
jgi:hypothetical protein